MKLMYILLLTIFIDSRMSATFEFVNNKLHVQDFNRACLSPKFMQDIKSEFGIIAFFETGTYLANTTVQAAAVFKEVYSVELADSLYERANKKLSNLSRVSLYKGSSPDIIKQIAPTIKGRILFWLDAHCSGGETAMSFDDSNAPEAMTAIRAELEAIKACNISDCVILIDDIRDFGIIVNGIEYLSCWAYPTVQELEQRLKEINPHFECVLLGDQLLAYDSTQYQPLFSPTVTACTKTRLYDGKNLTDTQLSSYQDIIKYASEHEKAFITQLYEWMTYRQDPMFWHDMWFGLAKLGSGENAIAKEAFSKVVIRNQRYNKRNELDVKRIPYHHPSLVNCLSQCK